MPRSTAASRWLILPMDLPGIDVRPLRTMEGSTEFCEVFFDEVRVPVANRVGAENDGWRVAMVTLSFERGTAFVSEMLQSMELVARPRRRSPSSSPATAPPPGTTAGLRRDIGRIAAELDALWALTKRNISQAQRTGLVGLGGNVFKLAYAELRQRLGDLADAPARPGIAVASTTCPATRHAAHARHVQRPDPRPVARDRRRHLAGAAQHRRRAGARHAEGTAGGRRRWRRPLMDFELADDEVALHDGIRSFLQGRAPLESLHPIEQAGGGVDRGLWSELADLGVFSLRADGFGASRGRARVRRARSGAHPRSARRHAPRRVAARRARRRCRPTAAGSSASSRPRSRSP